MGPLYVCSKRRARQLLSAEELKYYLWVLSLEPGDLVQDCDGFNHRVASLEYHTCRGVFTVDQVRFQDGGSSCGCPRGLGRACTPEFITEYHRMWNEYQVEHNTGFEVAWMMEALAEGRPLCDENGLRIND